MLGVIPDHILNALSAKGRGYVKAALKIAEGQRLVAEGEAEMRHLDDGVVGVVARKSNAKRVKVKTKSAPKAKPAPKIKAKQASSRAQKAKAKTTHAPSRDEETLKADLIAAARKDGAVNLSQLIRTVGGNYVRTANFAKQLVRDGAISVGKQPKQSSRKGKRGIHVSPNIRKHGLAMIRNGKTNGAIAAALNVSTTSIKRWRAQAPA